MEVDSELKDGILHIICKNEFEFINLLRPTNPLWKPDSMNWIFRGQAHSKWNLIPKVFRNGTKISFRDQRIGPISDIRQQMEYEWSLLNSFVWLSDEIGLQIPGDGIIFRDRITIENEIAKSINDCSWPPVTVLESMALAQHHGIPTRLLDFTRTGLIAAFFAGYWSLEINTEKEIQELGADYNKYGLCVWAISRKILDLSKNRINEHTVPRIGNRFLHAQNGLFLYDSDVNSFWKNKNEYPALENVISSLIVQNDNTDRSNLIVKIVLPFRFKHDLLRALRLERFTMAHLMPTYDMVAKTLEWQRDNNLLQLNFDHNYAV